MAELGAAAQVRAMILPTTIPARPREWETFKDPQSGCDYLYKGALHHALRRPITISS